MLIKKNFQTVVWRCMGSMKAESYLYSYWNQYKTRENSKRKFQLNYMTRFITVLEEHCYTIGKGEETAQMTFYPHLTKE